MNIQITKIGTINESIDGSDEYVLLRCDSEDYNIEDVREWLLQRCYRDTNTPGGYFCHRVEVLAAPYLGNEWIGIIYHSYDV